MKTNHRLIWPVILLTVLMGIAGCSSTNMNKASSLYLNGKTADALIIAEEILKPDHEESERIDAANLLGRIGKEKSEGLKERVGKTLLSHVDDPVRVVKNAVIRNLGDIRYEPAVDKLIAISLESDPDTVEEIILSLQSFGGPAISGLIEKALLPENASHLERIAILLLEIDRDTAVPLIIAEANHRFNGTVDKGEIQQLFTALNRLNDSRLNLFLKDFKNHTNPAVRAASQKMLD